MRSALGVSRAEFLRIAAGAVLLGGAELAGAPQAIARRTRGLSFQTRPDLRPPPVRSIAGPAAQSQPAEGFAFFGPSSRGGAQAGSLIVDAAGDAVWFRPVPRGTLVSNFKVQLYRGEPVLTWWEGEVLPSGYGRGVGVIVDSSYREIARVKARRGRHADLHEFTLTPHGTALITCYPELRYADLSTVGGPSSAPVRESILQEINIHTGKLVLEWRSLEHVAISESYLPPGSPYDYLHANSIEVLPDGNLLVGARHTWALYKLERRTGRVIWRLGGKRSDFWMGPGTRFAWQHDARHLADGAITVFDDGAGPQKTEQQSRGVTLRVDHRRRRVTMGRTFHHHPPWLSFAMGNMQALPGGNVVLGWGNVPMLSEFAPDGRWIRDLWLPWGHASYRAFVMPWSGTPRGRPAIAARSNRGAPPTVYASWNGATAVAAWQLSTGPSANQLQPARVVARGGFETAIPVAGSGGYAAVSALGPAGQPLASSRAIRLP